MKKLTFIIALTVFSTGSISASAPSTLLQQEQGQPSLEARAHRQIIMINDQLALTPEQTTKLKPIILARVTEQAAIREKIQNGDRQALMGEFRKLNEKYNAQIKTVLTAEQYIKYEASQAQMRGGGQRGGGQR